MKILNTFKEIRSNGISDNLRFFLIAMSSTPHVPCMTLSILAKPIALDMTHSDDLDKNCEESI